MKFLKLSSACTCYKNSFLVTLSYFTLTYISHAMFPPFIILHTYFQKLNSRDITAISLYILLFQTQFSRHHGYFLYVLCFPFYHTSMYIHDITVLYHTIFSKSILLTLNLFLGPRRRQLSQFKIGK